ncbi:calcium-translocating P-type ATPase [Neoconidiobolus thromboides FSU 785]|nr:calcium-translocating P-type ATPase [Neoconidiobolus thromboides FSU 785]
MKELKVNSVKKGLSSDETLIPGQVLEKKDFGSFIHRKEYYGKNILPEVKPRSLFSLMFEAYQDPTLIMLSIASLISLIIGVYEDSLKDPSLNEPKLGWVEGVAIQIAVLIVILTNAINDYQKEKQFRILNAKKEDRLVKVIRDSLQQEISVYKLVVGDVVLLEPGEIIPVDCLLVEGFNIICDESSATGESEAIKKGKVENSLDPFLLSGSKVLSGVGKAIVVAVGENSFAGKTLMSMREESDDTTPLQEKLGDLANQISIFGLAAAIVIVIVLVAIYSMDVYNGKINPSTTEMFSMGVNIIVQAITIVVVAVPEGLPMAVTLALAYATTQMIKDNNLVRVLASCETMGNATVLCSDKTGTLTLNEMTVVKGQIAKVNFEDSDVLKGNLDFAVSELLCKAISCNSSAFEGKDEKGNINLIGSRTECALLSFIQGMGHDFMKTREENNIVKVYPFSSEVKSMTTIVELNKDKCRLFSTGASEILLEKSKFYLDKDNVINEIDAEQFDRFNQTISVMADESLRTIAIGYKDIQRNVVSDKNDLESLILIGIVGIEDPLREGVTNSMEIFKKAGVQVKMITGDNLKTACAIAKKAGILTTGGIAMTGNEFNKLNGEQRLAVLPKLQVLARSSPSDKLNIVKGLKQLDEVVAMTGDGTNDGPALKLSDVGFGMGICGTEVAKEASSIILMDDNFNSIVNALRWGRSINNSVKKFLQFQITVNIVAVITSFYSSVVDPNHRSVLSTVQLLWVNLIMDTLAALALATEPPTDDLIDSYPASKKASLISYKMWKHIIGQSVFQLIVTLLLLDYGEHILFNDNDINVLNTAVFNTFVFLQVFNQFNCRRICDQKNVFENISNNLVFNIIQVIVVVGQLFLVQFGGNYFSTTPLTLYQHLITIAIGSLSLPIGLVLRLIPEPKSSTNQHHTPLVSIEQLEKEHLQNKKVN